MQAEIESAPPIDNRSEAVQQLMEQQLLGGLTKTTVLPGLHLGRAGDTVNDPPYTLCVCVTNAETNLHPSFQRVGVVTKLVQLPIVPPATDVGVESFTHQGGKPFREALQAVDAALGDGGSVLVCCQQGKDRSATLVLAYFIGKYRVDRQQALNFVQQRRPIVSCDAIPLYWDFLGASQSQFEAAFPATTTVSPAALPDSAKQADSGAGGAHIPQIFFGTFRHARRKAASGTALGNQRLACAHSWDPTSK